MQLCHTTPPSAVGHILSHDGCVHTAGWISSDVHPETITQVSTTFRIKLVQVYVGVAKRKTLAALDLRPEYAQWLTTNENEARIQVAHCATDTVGSLPLTVGSLPLIACVSGFPDLRTSRACS